MSLFEVEKIADQRPFTRGRVEAFKELVALEKSLAVARFRNELVSVMKDTAKSRTLGSKASVVLKRSDALHRCSVRLTQQHSRQYRGMIWIL